MEEKNIYNIVRKNIKKYRKLNKNKITQEQLAELIDVSASYISGLESDKSNKGISINVLYRISIVLDVPINKFFEVTNDR